MFCFSKGRFPFSSDLIKRLFKAVLLDEDLLEWRFIFKKKINTEGNVISEEKNQFNLLLFRIVFKGKLYKLWLSHFLYRNQVIIIQIIYILTIDSSKLLEHGTQVTAF